MKKFFGSSLIFIAFVIWVYCILVIIIHNDDPFDLKGDVIGILNADDIYVTQDVVKKVSNEFASNPEIEGVFSNLKYTDKNNKVIRTWKTGPLNKELLSRGWIIPHPTLFVKREIYQKCGDYDLSYGNAADYEFILRMICNYNVKLNYLDFFSVNMKVGGESNRNFLNILNQNRAILRALKKYNIHYSFIHFFIYKIFNRLLQYIKK